MFSTLFIKKQEDILLPIDESIVYFPSKDYQHNVKEYRHCLNLWHVEGSLEEFIKYVLEKYIVQLKQNILRVKEMNIKVEELIQKLKDIKIKEKYFPSIVQLILTNKYLYIKKAMPYFVNLDRRTIQKLFNQLAKAKIISKKIAKEGRNIIYEVLE